ncbi:MAG: 3-oxoacid CoA-transferase subunit B [Cellulomonadaceae bacterium]|nr:3-oxoacid CoA-transferase subunit B [Cellulomonadaceae bacterium]
MDKTAVKELIAARVAKELRDGELVNLGIGLPTLIPGFLPPGVHVTLATENGIVAAGSNAAADSPDARYVVNAGGQPASCLVGGAFIDSATSFGIIRGGHVDTSVLGALEVDQHANLANWIIPGKMVPGMGGAMDLVVGARKVIVAMEHTQRGAPKILRECTLPLTALACVTMIVTEMGVMVFRDGLLVLEEINPVFTVDEVLAATQAELVVSDHLVAMV